MQTPPKKPNWLDIVKLWFNLKLEASTTQCISPNMKIWFLRKSRPYVYEDDENEFAGSRKGWKWWGRCLSTRSAKTRRKTPHTLRHMLKFHSFAIHWYEIYTQNVAASRSNRLLKSRIFTCVSMGHLFTVVRPYLKVRLINSKFEIFSQTSRYFL